MSRYVNGVKMGFAMAAYAEDYMKRLEQEEQEELDQMKECVKFTNIEIGGIKDDEEISFDVREGSSVNIYVDDDLVYGPIEGGCRVTII